MADQSTALPVRSEADGNDERLQTKIVDATNPDTQQAEVDANNDLHVRAKIVDESGNDFSDSNPLPVSISENEGAEIHDYDTAASIVKDATSDHDYVVANGTTFLFYGYRASASGKMKVELQIGDGAVSEVFATKEVEFNSVAQPNLGGDLYRVPIKVIGTVNGTTIKLIRTNLDNQAQDLYSTIIGVEQS